LSWLSISQGVRHIVLSVAANMDRCMFASRPLLRHRRS
jgi:hypothetical protein